MGQPCGEGGMCQAPEGVPGHRAGFGLRVTFHCSATSGFRAICNRADESESFIGKCLFEKHWLRGSEG